MPQAEPTTSTNNITTTNGGGGGGGGNETTVLFNTSKKEINHPNSGFKKLHRKLRNNFKISMYVNSKKIVIIN